MAGRVIGVVAWLVFLACGSPHGFAIDYHVDGAAASRAIAPRSERSTSSGSPRLVYSQTRPTVLSDVIHQNTPGNSEGYPAGLDWDKGSHQQRAKPPSEFSAVTGWGQVYPEAGVSPNAASDTVKIEIDRFKTYVHLTTGGWVKVQDQAQVGIGGAHYVADFAGDANIPWSQQTLSDGSVSVDAPPAGYNDHFWPGARGTYTPGTVDGVFVTADMKTNDPNASLVANLGADWWLNSTAPYVSDFSNNPGAGGSNYTKLTTQWQTLYYTSLSPRQLEADPPAHLLSTPRPRR